MFAVFCRCAGTRRLMGFRSILALHNTTRGPALVFECHCGDRGILLRGTHQFSFDDDGTGLAPLADAISDSISEDHTEKAPEQLLRKGPRPSVGPADSHRDASASNERSRPSR